MSNIDSFTPHSLLSDRAPDETKAEERPALGAAAKAMEPIVLRALFKTHYASVWRLLRRFGVPRAQLDDAAQEVFWVAARRLTEIQVGKERAFLYGVALRIASNAVRRRRRAVATTELDDVSLADLEPNPEEQLEQRQARAVLDSVFDRMPLELRTVFVLFELEGFTAEEIAELEQIPVGTASSRLRRARQEFSAIATRVRSVLNREGQTR